MCGCFCLQFISKSESQQGSILRLFLAPGRGCTENRGVLVAQALLELTAKLVDKQTIWLFVKLHKLTACWLAGKSGY